MMLALDLKNYDLNVLRKQTIHLGAASEVVLQEEELSKHQEIFD